MMGPVRSDLGQLVGDFDGGRSRKRAAYHSAVWTGTRMLVWGGYGGDPLGDGASYDPGSNTWSPIAGLGAPSPRYVHRAVWTGTQMIVWGGRDGAGNLRRWGALQPRVEHVVPDVEQRRTRRSIVLHGDLDRRRNDRVGR